MKTYTIHHRSNTSAGALADPDDALFVKDGMAWAALFVPVLWALWNRLWLVAACIFALGLALAGILEILGLRDVAAIPAFLLFNLLVALEGNGLHRRVLERRGYNPVGLVTAPSLHEAELLYFGRLLADREENGSKTVAPATALRLEAADGDLFPAAGG